MTYTPQERPLTRKSARALARLIKNAQSVHSAPDARPLAKYVLNLPFPKKRKWT